jgi:hypothetical protein
MAVENAASGFIVRMAVSKETVAGEQAVLAILSPVC